MTNWSYLFAPRCAIPAILYTCHESREVGLEHYDATLSGTEVVDEYMLGKAVDVRNAMHLPPTGISREGMPIYWAAKDDLVSLVTLPADGTAHYEAKDIRCFPISSSQALRLEGVKYVAM